MLYYLRLCTLFSPDRILVDTGGAIAMGFVGSVLYQVFLQPKDKPGFRLKYLKQRVFRTTGILILLL